MARDLGNIARFQETTLERLSDSLAKALRKSLDALNERSRRAAAKLNLLNPLGILERGYSVTRLEGPDGRIVRSPEDAPTGTRIVSILSGGRILSVTEEETQK
jgi:exodeoxyribonuclease VII large subunit